MYKNCNSTLIHTCVDVLAVSFSCCCGYDPVSISRVGQVMWYVRFLYGCDVYVLFCSSCIMSSCLVADIKLSGFRERMFSVLYPLLVLIVVGRFCLSRKIMVLAFLCFSRFFRSSSG